MCNLEIYQCKNRTCRWRTHITTTIKSFWCGSDDPATRSQWTSCHDPKLEVTSYQGSHCPYFTPSKTLINKETSYCYPCFSVWQKRNVKAVDRQRKLDRIEKAKIEEEIVARQRGILEMIWKQDRKCRTEKARVKGEAEKRAKREEMRRRQEDERHAWSLEVRRRRESERRDRVLDRKKWEFEESEVRRIEGKESLRVRMVSFVSGC